jgi:hypothetical protein
LITIVNFVYFWYFAEISPHYRLAIIRVDPELTARIFHNDKHSNCSFARKISFSDNNHNQCVGRKEYWLT